MKTLLLALALIVVCTEVRAGVLDDVYYFLYPNRRPVVVEPSVGPKREVSPRQAPEPAAAPKPVASNKSSVRVGTPTKPKPQAKAEPLSTGNRTLVTSGRPPARVCSAISMGMSVPWGGRAYVISEAAKRGYSKAQTEAAIRACGY